MSGLLIRYKVSGNRLEYLLAWLHAKNVKIYDVKTGKNVIFLTIEQKDGKKLFAISSNMCYNIKKIGYKGKYAPIKVLSEKIGLAVGGLLFVLGAIITDNTVKDAVYLADAAEFKSEIDCEIKDLVGFHPFKLADGSFSAAAARIAEKSDEISFISIKKDGTPKSAAVPKQMICLLVRFKKTFVLTLDRSRGTGTYDCMISSLMRTEYGF